MEWKWSVKMPNGSAWVAWLNVYRVDLVLFQEVNEVRSTLLDRCEARGRA